MLHRAGKNRLQTHTKSKEGEPRIMQRAYSLKNALEKINISAVEPEELIVKIEHRS